LSPEREEAELLLRKAREDRTVIAKLVDDSERSDSVIGFHAQQAVEKALKAILAARGADFPWTHDLQLPLRRVEAAGVDVPALAQEARQLSPWAVEFRYGEVIDDQLDRQGTARMVTEIIDWSENEVLARLRRGGA
jgi:HEPN domain-containing protein